MKKTVALAAVLVGAVMAMAPPAAAFELLRTSGNPCSADANLRWSPARVGVDTSPLNAQRRELAEQAIDIWQRELGSRFTFTSGSGRPCTLNDGVTTLAFRDTDCQGNAFGGDTLAITVTSWVGNRIVDADVAFNPAATLSNAGFRQVAMHELGHVLGLDHSDACGNPGRGTLMNSRLTEAFSAPQADDIAGARFIYPTGNGGGGGGGGGEVPSGSNSCAIAPPGGGSTTPLALGFVLLALGMRLFGRGAKSSVDRGRDLF